MEPEENNQENADPQSMYKEPGLQETRATAQEIVDGARNEDQLNKFKQAAPGSNEDDRPEPQQGSQPNAYQTPKERGEQTA